MKRNEKVDGSPLLSWVWSMLIVFLDIFYDDFGEVDPKEGSQHPYFYERHVLKENMFDFRSPQIIRVDTATCFRPKGRKHNFQI